MTGGEHYDDTIFIVIFIVSECEADRSGNIEIHTTAIPTDPDVPMDPYMILSEFDRITDHICRSHFHTNDFVTGIYMYTNKVLYTAIVLSVGNIISQR
jgi:hypothetical protein